jgi:hypothetical protein
VRRHRAAGASVDAHAQGQPAWTTAEGRIEATRGTLLVFLESRGLDPTHDEQQRIETCQDLNRLEAWVGRAATVGRVADLFE